MLLNYFLFKLHFESSFIVSSMKKLQPKKEWVDKKEDAVLVHRLHALSFSTPLPAPKPFLSTCPPLVSPTSAPSHSLLVIFYNVIDMVK